MCNNVENVAHIDNQLKNINIREIRQELGRLDDLLAREGEVILTRHGKPIARMLPITQESGSLHLPSLKWLRDKMVKQKIGTEVLIREDRDARE